jgi:hypothetical protein
MRLQHAQFPSLASKRVSPHSIRHSCATHLLRAGVDINTIRGWLGHVSIDTTNIYAEIDLEMKAAPAFERSLGNADQLGQSLRAPVAQAGTQSRGEHHDGSPIDAPAQKAHRHWRGATTADRTTKTQTVVTLPIDIARSAARFTGIAGAVQNTATRATGGTGPGSLILIDTFQEFKELGVEQRAMAHWGVSLVLSD